MYTGLVHMHNLLRWVIVITLVLSLINAFKGKNGKETLIMMISSHVMLLIGLVQWFGGELGLKQIKNSGMGEAMKNAAIRFCGGTLVDDGDCCGFDYDSTSFGEGGEAQYKMVFVGCVTHHCIDDARTMEVRHGFAKGIVSGHVIGFFG